MYLTTANGQQFPAVGTGNIIVSMPNDDSQSQLTLENMLHAPSAGYTLVSLGALDRLGYCINIGGGHLDILSSAGEQLARVPCSVRGLYCVTHTEGVEGVFTVEMVSIMELHRRMG